MAPLALPVDQYGTSTWYSTNAVDWSWAWRAVAAAPALSPVALARLNLARVRRVVPRLAGAGTGRYRSVPVCAAPRRVVVERGQVGWIHRGGRRPLRGLA